MIKKNSAASVEEQYDERGRLIITDSSKIPENMTEEEVVDFWDTYAMSEELLNESYIEEDDLLPPRKSATKPINLRIENDLLNRLQKIAESKQIPYQTLLK
ncbi:CopG family antitoxin [Radiobacillus sp. PE A8.2]|uniref:CopG family antitoxin n=1 Tax=Radiobacillus sp. PE A8.2 TaxID=3380349 RepID=UPI00388CFF4A